MPRFLAGLEPNYLIHSAVEKALMGEANPKKGRSLSARSCQSMEASLQCLQGIINSDLSNACRLAEQAYGHEPSPEEESKGALADDLDLGLLLERRDLARVSSERFKLIAEAEPALEPMIRHRQVQFHEGDSGQAT
jgi:hypothetical protein